MRNTTIWLFIGLIGLSAFFYSFSGEVTDYPSGSPAGYTGSPGDGQNCTSCHNGTASNVSGWITSDIPGSGYVAGTTYTITVTVTGSGAKGFEVSPQNLTGTLLGTLIAGTGSHLTGSGKYVTHSSAPSGNPSVWSFSWVAPAAGTGAVTFYGAFCVSKPVTKLSTLTVNEAAAPLTANASATPSTIVAGQSTQLNVVATGGSGGYTYAWTSVPPGFTSSIQNPVASPTVNTTYNVTVTSGTQTANSSAAVTVYQPLTALASATPSTLIAGETTQLDVTVTGGTGTNTYSWTSVPPGFTSSLKNPVASPTVNTTYNVTVTSGTQTANGSAAVTVYQPLTAQATATPGTITAGETSQLDVTVTGGTGTNTYAWTSVPSGFTSSLKNPVVSPIVTTTYNVTVTSGTQNANSSATVTVNQPIPLTVDATATPSSILPGESSQLNAIASGGSGTFTYSWTSNPPGFTSNIQNPIVTPAATTEYFVVVGDGVNTNSDSVVVTVTLNPLTASATSDPSTVCEGQTSQLNVTASGGSGTYTYSWTSVPPGFTSNLQNPVVQPTLSTQYIANVTDGSQNATSTTDVTVIPAPTVSAGNDTSYCDNVTQIPVSGSAGSFASLLWSTSGDGTFGDASALNTFYFPGQSDLSSGSVDLTLTASPLAPCSSSSSSEVHIAFDPCTGIPAGHEAGLSVSLSPNPTSGVVRISATGMEHTTATVVVYDSRGIEVYEKVLDLSGNSAGSIDLTGNQRGLYFVRVQADGHIKTMKLILM